MSVGRLSWWAAAAVFVASGCGQVRAPPPTLFFDGLPVSGRLIDAKRAGFDDCFGLDAVTVRCRRHDVWVAGTGPFEAAVDLRGSDGQGGFDQLTFWHKRDNYAVYALAEAFERSGWRYCYTGDDRWGDQMIYTRPGKRLRVSMDLSYYGKRRLRLIPLWNRRERTCLPESAEYGVASLRR